MNLFTIGVYGYTEDEFFNALKTYSIDIFCDVRLRRGMRGKKYSFVNSIYLQEKLKIMGIEYFHYKDLAPSKEIRDIQKRTDANVRIQKQKRTSLSVDFKKAYAESCLINFKSDKFLNKFDNIGNNILFFCVEQAPEACHRSILTDKLTKESNSSLTHILL